MKKQLFAALLFFCTLFKVQSQIAGSFTVPGSFPTIAAAINTLNLTGVAGAVTINVMAGYTETVPVGGLKLISPPGSFTTTILFKKLGVGANPLLLAYAGGTATTNSAKRDGIWQLAGCRNITIEEIDLTDQNTSTPATMEFGYGLYKTTSGGNINNTIRNCVITLAAPNSGNSCGIDVSVHNFTLNTMTVSPSSSVMTNSLNKFHNNYITKCDVAIWMNGYNMNFYDTGNDIGGLSAVTGNTLVNLGGSGWYPTGIYAGNQMQFNASYNIINNNDGTGAISSIGARGIFVTGTNSSINSNTISLTTNGGSSTPLVGITQTGFSTGTVSVSNNIFPVLSCTNTSGITVHKVIYTEDNPQALVNNNQIGYFTTTSGTINLISAIDGNTTTINNNTISGATITTHGLINGIYSTANYPKISNNSISNLYGYNSSPSNYTTIYGVNSIKGWGLSVTSNTIGNLRGNLLYGISLTSTMAAATYSITDNHISGLGASPSNTIGTECYGIRAINTTTTNGSMTLRSNTIFNLVGKKLPDSSQGTVNGILGDNGVNNYVSQNKIYDLSSDGSYGVFGIQMGGAQNYIYNNLVGGLNISSDGPVYTLHLGNAVSSKVHFNSLYLNASASTSTVGTFAVGSANNSNIELKNNVIVNATNGPGPACCLIINFLSPSSNNNAFYFSPGGRILGSTLASTNIAGLQAVYNSDAQSFIENVNFVSTVGANPNFLNINTSIPTQIESGAVAIATITTDFINATRSATPDVGAWEGNYVAADVTAPLIVSSGFTGPPCNGTTRTFTANITDVSGVASGSLSPRVYHRVNFGLYTSTQGTLVSGTATNGIWSFALNYTAVTNDVIWHFLVMQDVSYLNNVKIIPATNATVTDVNNVPVPPNPANNYTIQTNPTISLPVTNTTICTGQSYIIQANGASSYTYSPGNNPIVAPVINTFYSVWGASSLGCPSTNTLVLALTVAPLPTITVNSGSICAGASFTMVPNGAVSYTYQGGSAVVSPAATSNYTVAGSGANGCTNNATSNITVVAPVLTLTAVQNTVCVGEPVSVSVAGAVNYTWQPGPQSGTTYTTILNATTVFTVHGSDANGCQATANITLVADPCTGIIELQDQTLQLWPNPTNGNFYISQQGKANRLLIKVKDLSGRLILQNTSKLETTQIDLSAYANGVYVVEVVADDVIISRAKLILAQQ